MLHSDGDVTKGLAVGQLVADLDVRVGLRAVSGPAVHSSWGDLALAPLLGLTRVGPAAGDVRRRFPPEARSRRKRSCRCT